MNDPVISETMVEAGFLVLSRSGIADDYLGADKLLVADIYRAMFAASQDGELKLFVLGERSGDPEDWSNVTGSRAIVIARDEKEAISLSDSTAPVATEIVFDGPKVLMTESG